MEKSADTALNNDPRQPFLSWALERCLSESEMRFQPYGKLPESLALVQLPRNPMCSCPHLQELFLGQQCTWPREKAPGEQPQLQLAWGVPEPTTPAAPHLR